MSEFGSEGELPVAALIGDLVQSRRSGDRSALQRRLLLEVKALNTRLGVGMLSRLTLQRGDEVQVVLGKPELVVEVVTALSDAIHPNRLAFGLGYGTLDTDLSPETGEIDGPAFHRAREALEETGADAWLVARGFGEPTDEAITALFALMGAIRLRWTEKQLRYVRAARQALQKHVAARFDVAESTVSESLSAASWPAVHQAEKAVRTLLRKFGPEGEAGASSSREPNS